MSRHLDEEQKLDVEHVDVTHKKDSEDGNRSEVLYVPDTEEERRLVRKIDKRMLPMLWVMYVFNYIDRTNIGNAKTGGMEKDFNLSSSDYSLILSIFFVGYLLNEVPCNMILSRTRPSLFLPTTMLLWGGMSIGAKGIENTGGMVAFRFVLGLVEAGFFPGVMLLLSCWYKPKEMSKRIAFFYTASLMSGAFGGILAGVIIDGMEGLANTRGWKWLFIIEGLATVCISFIAYFVLPDYPSTTKWLTDEEQHLAVARLQQQEELAADGTEMTHKQAFIAAVKDPKIYVFMLIYNLLNSVGTISYFFPTLMTSLGYTGRLAQFMTVPVYVVAMIVSTTLGWNADRTGHKALHVIGACILSLVSFVICVAVPTSQVRYTFICFGGAGIWSAVPIFLSWMVTMFEGREKRAISIAIINGVGNLASVYGSFFWPSQDAPRYIKGFAITTALCGTAGAVAFAAKWKYGDKGVVARRHGH